MKLPFISLLTVQNVDVRFVVTTCQRLGAGGAPPPWEGTIAPGATVRVRNAAGGGGSGSFGAAMIGGADDGISRGRGLAPPSISDINALRVFLWIDRVDVNECVYSPSQIISMSVCRAEGSPSQ